MTSRDLLVCVATFAIYIAIVRLVFYVFYLRHRRRLDRFRQRLDEAMKERGSQ